MDIEANLNINYLLRPLVILSAVLVFKQIIYTLYFKT